MNIGIIGSGGREHALCFKLKKSKKIKKLFCIPGNAGTSEICENININYQKFDKLYDIIKKKNIELLIIGPETPLVNGIVDYFKNKKIDVFGPNKLASKLEGSKSFMKDICKNYKIPTAKYAKISNLKKVKSTIKSFNIPIVIKSDGLAAGKGVTICHSYTEAIHDAEKLIKGKFKSSKKVIVEEYLEGEEASYFVITDGKNYLPIGTAQDYKRIGENDTGPNTGGMGAYSPSLIINKIVEKKIKKKIIEPTLKAMKDKGCEFKGILYAGLMIKQNEPYLIEYNIRFGDPECQVIMMRLKNDLIDLILASLKNNLHKKKIKWLNNPCIAVVASSKGYPGKYKKNIEIKNIDKIKKDKNVQLFHAGTIKDKNNKIYSNGGRVLNSTVIGLTLSDARKKALKLLDSLIWKNKYYRRDIGFKAIKK